jgi:hypothetical protein
LGDDLDADQRAAPTLGLAGRYIVRRELGRGMMGVVYEAEDTLLGRTVAVKTIELAFGVAEETFQHFEERFFTEARVAAKLSHPGIVVCHDVGKDPASGKLFIVFEYLKGLTLADRVVADTIAWEDAVAIVIKVARAIHHAHLNGVIHRDLKPANVMLLDSGQAGLESSDATAIKIMDFGVARLESLPARLTRTGQSFGSPLYMSPEQVLGSAATARSDIFSLGSILCTLLLGHGWFEARNIPEVLSRVVHDDAPLVSKLRAHLPGTLDDVIARALAKRPEDRYSSAAAMADDLEDVLAGQAPRHASAYPAPPAPALGGSAERDTLLADLARDVVRGAAGVDPADALASLVDEPPSPAAAAPSLASAKADRTLPVQTIATGSALRVGERRAGAEVLPPQAAADLTLPSWEMIEPAAPAPKADLGAEAAEDRKPVAEGRKLARPRLLPRLGAVAALAALLIVGAFLSWQRTGSRSGPSAEPDTPAPAVSGAKTPSVPPSPATDRGDTPAPAPAATLTASTPPETDAPAADAPRPAATVRPRPIVAAPTAVPEPAGPATAPSESARQSRMRLVVEHPFESGRFVLWIDGVLVYETKLQASASKTIVAIKVREGRHEKLLDVEPGRHEVRVEVSWEDQHRVGTQLVDVAAGSTGLLEVRVARVTNSLSLQWSRLAD